MVPKSKAELLTEIHTHYDRLCADIWTMGRMIQFNTSSPYKNARTRLRRWLKTQQGA